MISDVVFNDIMKKHFNFFGCAPPLPAPTTRRRLARTSSRMRGSSRSGMSPTTECEVIQLRGQGVTQQRVIQTACAITGGGHYLNPRTIHHGSSSKATTTTTDNNDRRRQNHRLHSRRLQGRLLHVQLVSRSSKLPRNHQSPLEPPLRFRQGDLQRQR